jgi:hypothetical protein
MFSALMDFEASLAVTLLNFFGRLGVGQLAILAAGIGSLLAWDTRFIRKTLGDFASGLGGPLVTLGARSLALLQSVLIMQFGERALTAKETEVLTRVYRSSIVFFNVRVVDGFVGFFSTNTRPFTVGNKIYMKSTAPAAYMSTLVHECCHVWQHQHEGIRYISDALWAQGTLPGQGYSWEAELGRGNLRWQDFNKEAQASLLEEIFDTGTRDSSTGNGAFYEDDPIGSNVKFEASSGRDYTGFARASVAYVRSAPWVLPRP